MDNRHGEMDTYSGRNLAPRPYMYNSESEDSSEECNCEYANKAKDRGTQYAMARSQIEQR